MSTVQQPLSGAVPSTGPRLRKNAVGLTGVVMQGIACIAPAFGVAVTFQFAVTEAGVTAPLVFFFAWIVILMLTRTTGWLANAFPSSGAFYSYVSRTINVESGFIVGWIFSLVVGPPAALAPVFLSKTIIEPELKDQWGVTIPWWLFAVPIIVGIAFLCLRGIVISQKVLVFFGLAEIAIVVALALTSLISPGDGGFNVDPLNPANIPTLSGMYLGIVFSLFGFQGWESITPLAEEAKDPRKTVPQALTGAVFIYGIFLIFCTWAFLVGLGTNTVDAIAGSARNPTFLLAEHLWSGAWVLFLLAMLNSVIAIVIAIFNASSRMWYAMGRAGTIPKTFGVIDPGSQVPRRAIYLECGVAAVTFVTMLIFGAANVFFVWALAITYGLIFVYCALNFGAAKYYLGKARDQFRPLPHLVFPILTSAAMLVVGYKSIVPFPTGANKWAPIVIAVWIAIGVGIVAVQRLRGRREWLVAAAEALEDADTLPDRVI
jgi:amino acid transporter